MSDTHPDLQRLGKELDKDRMIERVRSFPSQMKDAWARGGAFAASLTAPASPPRQILVCGMGGSAIGGDMVRSYFGDALRVPLHVNRNYAVPPALARGALWVFSSYSGNTGETLAAYDAWRGSGDPAVAVTSGGQLAQRCAADQVPVCSIPGGMPPRSAIAYSFFPLVQIVAAHGLAAFDPGEFEETYSQVTRRCEDLADDKPDSYAAELARRLRGKLPFIYSCGGLFDAVARRWSCQFNENSKSLAHYAAYPELNHNEIVGWKALEELRGQIEVILLEDEEDHPHARKQAEIALEIVEPLCAGVIKLAGESGPRMARILSMMILGDFASVYLAYLNGVDPTPVENIDFLKSRLKSELD